MTDQGSESSLSEDDGKKQQEEKGHKLSAKGKRMAASVAEFLLMRYFFPDVKDKKKQQKAKEDFMIDMNFDLSKGLITKTTTKLGNRKLLVSTKVFTNTTLGRDFLSCLRSRMRSFCILRQSSEFFLRWQRISAF